MPKLETLERILCRNHETIQSYIAELEAHGYLEKPKKRLIGKDGRFLSNRYTLHENPQRKKPLRDEPATVRPATVEPATEKAATISSLSHQFPSSTIPTSTIAPTQAVAWSVQSGWQNVEQLKKDFQKAYPACDFDRQLVQAELWLKANPIKAHKSNWLRFITNWFKREQDRGRDVPSQRAAQNGAPSRFLSFEDRKKRKGEIQEQLNAQFRTRKSTGFTEEEEIERQRLRAEMEAL